MEKDLNSLIEKNFNQIVGHKFQKEIFKKLLLKDHFHLSYIFYGPSGIGKKFFASKIAEIIFSQTSNKDLQHHPDFAIVRPERRDIPVEKIRDIVDFSLHPPLEGRKKIIIIDEAHKLNPQSGNALLKTLEESPDFMLFFLITTSPEKLLPTIRSRNISIRFNLLSEDETIQVVKKMGEEIPDLLFSLFYGQPGLIKSMNKEFYLDMTEKLLQFFTGEINGLIDFPGKRKIEGEEIEIFVRALYSIISDIIRIINGLKPSKWTNLEKYEKIIRQRWNLNKISKLYSIIAQLEREMAFSQNFKLFIDLMLIVGVS